MNKLLIVIDMQNDFIDGSLGTKEAVNIVPNVIKKIKEYDGEVIYTRDTHDEKYLQTQEGINLPVIHCLKESKGWNIKDEIMVLAENSKSKIFNKPSFGSTELVDYIKEIYSNGQVAEVEIIGLCTDICVISNAIMIKSSIPEIKVIVDSNCCAGVTPQSHKNALEAMKMCQIKII